MKKKRKNARRNASSEEEQFKRSSRLQQKVKKYNQEYSLLPETRRILASMRVKESAQKELKKRKKQLFFRRIVEFYNRSI